MTSHEDLRRQLLARLEELVGRARLISADLRRPGDRDSEERAIELENDEVLEGLDELTRTEVSQLRHAIARIDDGTYGICARCGSPIAPARLAALPAASMCAKCADHAQDVR